MRWRVVLVAALCVYLGPRLAAQTRPASRPASPPAQVAAPTGMTNADVIKMVTATLSDDLIINSIRQAPKRNFDFSVDGLVALKLAKVSDAVIRVMQSPDAIPEPIKPAVALPPPPPATKEVMVQDGTEVKLRLLKAISSATARVDDRVELEAVEDLVVQDLVIVRKGAVATGKVIEALEKKSFGRQGKLNFSIDYVKAVDGQNVRLRATKETKGGDSYGKAGVVTLLAGPFGALVKGKDVDIVTGTQFTIFVDGDRPFKLTAGAPPK